MKKLFGGINLTWKKLIIFAVVAAVYTALMAIIPITKDTSFRDIATFFEWWILFGIIIICNSKSAKDSALKCFVFFLISQPLIYLFQVPFSDMGWSLFGYYKYWFIWTIACLPMGFIGYYIKRNNILSVIILIPMLLFLSYLGLGYLGSAIDSFPHHLLSCILCFLFIVIIVLNILDKKILRIIAFAATGIFIAIFVLLNTGLGKGYEAYKTLSQYDIKLEGEALVTFFSGTKKGEVVLIPYEDSYNLKLVGHNKGYYKFDLTDENNNVYSFEYYFDKEQNTVILNILD